MMNPATRAINGLKLHNNEFIRMQGGCFKAIKKDVTLVAYSRSGHNNFCGYYAYTEDLESQPEGAHCYFYHWMNEWEINKFIEDKMLIRIPCLHDGYKEAKRGLFKKPLTLIEALNQTADREIEYIDYI